MIEALLGLLSLVILGGLGWVILTVALARRSASLSAPHSSIGIGRLADWASSINLQIDECRSQVPPFTQLSGLDKTQAEEVLDWLENHGWQGEVTHDETSGFTVRRK